MTVLRDIVNEANWYARAPNRNGTLLGGRKWKLLTMQEFKVFLAITLYMAMKQQSSVRSYLHLLPNIFHHPLLSKLLFKNWYELLTKCFPLEDLGD